LRNYKNIVIKIAIMKHILLTLFLFLSLCVNAQIQRTFFGQTFGEATKQDVKEMLVSKGVSVEDYDSNNIVARDLTFGGKKWSHVVFKFYNGNFYSVVFGMQSLYENRSSVEESISEVISILKKKYPNYLLKEEEDNVMFIDLKTMASVSYTEVNAGVSAYGLSYSDVETLFKDVQSTEDEF